MAPSTTFRAVSILPGHQMANGLQPRFPSAFRQARLELTLNSLCLYGDPSQWVSSSSKRGSLSRKKRAFRGCWLSPCHFCRSQRDPRSRAPHKKKNKAWGAHSLQLFEISKVSPSGRRVWGGGLGVVCGGGDVFVFERGKSFAKRLHLSIIGT